MVEINNLKYDIEALSAEREALRKEVESLEAKRDDLFEGVRDAEQMKCVAWDSYNALADHLNTEEKQREFANNYWEHVHRTVKIDMEFVLSRTVCQRNRVGNNGSEALEVVGFKSFLSAKKRPLTRIACLMKLVDDFS